MGRVVIFDFCFDLCSTATSQNLPGTIVDAWSRVPGKKVLVLASERS